MEFKGVLYYQSLDNNYGREINRNFYSVDEMIEVYDRFMIRTNNIIYTKGRRNPRIVLSEETLTNLKTLCFSRKILDIHSKYKNNTT